MCSESNVELWQFISQYMSTLDTKNMNLRILNKVLSQLFSPGIKPNVRTRSALAVYSQKNRSKFSIWKKIYQLRKTVSTKISVDKRKIKNQLCENIRNYLNHNKLSNTVPKVILKNVCDIPNKNSLPTFMDKITVEDEVPQCNLGYSIESNKNKVPIIYLKDILTTQGRVTKCDFFKYFGLNGNENKYENGSDSTKGNNRLVRFSQAVNVPISSDLGKKMALRDNIILSENFKLRKIQRYEWYVNKPYKKEASVTDKSDIQKRQLELLASLKPVTVILERLDFSDIHFSNKNCVRRPRKLKEVQVIIENGERRKVDEIVTKQGNNVM